VLGGSVVISADLIVATGSLLSMGGGAVAWLVRRGDRAVAKVEGKMVMLEKRYATLRLAFQMVANELSRHDPKNPILLRAQTILLRDYGAPIDDDEFDDLLDKII
jgi:hypothetical protein